MSNTETDPVNGEWGDFVFRRATLDDFDVISKLLREHFYPDEPFTILLGTSEEYESEIDSMFRAMLHDNLSFLAFEKSTSRVAGVRLNFHNSKDRPLTSDGLKAAQTKKIVYLLNLLNEKSQLFDTYNITELANLFMTCVHRDFRGRGLVTEMYRRTVALSRSRGYVMAMATFTSPFSRAGATKLGFKEVARIPLQGLRDQHGELVVPGAGETNFITQAIYIL